jgi:DNA-binding winged helix-turn-helix (wHTH) protein/tetratricopeptide (TPR) repeat protein
VNTPAQRSARRGIDLATSPSVRLLDVRLEPAELKLHGPKGSVTLEPRVMQVLVHLFGTVGQVASRNELLQSCWGSVVVGDDALNRAVAGARRALRQAGSTDVTLQTIPRVGYMLVAPELAIPPPTDTDRSPDARLVPGAAAKCLEPTDGEPAASQPLRPEPPPPLPATPTARIAATRRLVVLGAATVAATGVAAAWWAGRRSPVPEAVRELLDTGRHVQRMALPQIDQQGTFYFEQAVVLAPRHAPAWGQLALARRQAAEFAPPPLAAGLLAGVEEASARALALDPRQPDALTARALLRPLFGHWTETARRLEEVLQIDPDHLPTLDMLAFTMASMGQLAAHYPLRLRTLELDPLHAGYNFRAIYSHWMNGNLAAADRAGERGLDLWPRHLATWLGRCSLFSYTGRADRTLRMLADENVRPTVPQPLLQTLRTVATALASGQDTDRAAARAATLAAVERGGPLLAVGATMDLSALGDTAAALDVTEAYLLERGPLMTATAWRSGQPLHNDVRRRLTNHLFLPVTAPLRAEPRFAAVAEAAGLAAAWAEPGRFPDHLATARN